MESGGSLEGTASHLNFLCVLVDANQLDAAIPPFPHGIHPFGRGDRWLHHGTLLLHADLGRLAHYLTVKPSKIASKGVASVRSRVANLEEFAPGLDHVGIGAALLEVVAEEYGGSFSVEKMDPAEMVGGELAEKAGVMYAALVCADASRVLWFSLRRGESRVLEGDSAGSYWFRLQRGGEVGGVG